jgi:16S rRNA C967 or C1407 C5-methylase (RsmB/RsmF family)
MGVTQRQILQNAASHVKPEGTLVYSVCSTEREEGTDVAESMSGWSIEKTWSSAPPQGDEDGFQAFVLRRNTT